MEKDDIEAAVLNAFELALEAQLKAVRRARTAPKQQPKRSKDRSQVNLVYDILRKAGKPLHVTDIIERVEKVHRQRLDRESIVSALVKKVNRGDRFVRTDRNVFGLKGGE
jgi:hypothetical protein